MDNWKANFRILWPYLLKVHINKNISQERSQFHSNTAFLKTATTAPDYSITISEQEQAELYAPRCIIKQAALTFTSNEAREFYFKTKIKNGHLCHRNLVISYNLYASYLG